MAIWRNQEKDVHFYNTEKNHVLERQTQNHTGDQHCWYRYSFSHIVWMAEWSRTRLRLNGDQGLKIFCKKKYLWNFQKFSKNKRLSIKNKEFTFLRGTPWCGALETSAPFT